MNVLIIALFAALSMLIIGYSNIISTCSTYVKQDSANQINKIQTSCHQY